MSLKQCLIILGMHRSGTSALTGALAKLGMMTSNHLLQECDQFNPKGFWEHADIATINEELLQALNSSWSDCRPLPADWWKTPVSTGFKQRIIEVIRRDFSDSPLWVLKDPRICRLLPLWLDLLGELNFESRFLVVLRHPTEVAASLARRNSIPVQRASMLWLRYAIDSEHWTRNQVRSFVTYDNLLADWRSVIATAGRELSLPLNMDDKQAAHAVDEFLEPRLRHHVASDMANQDGRLLDIAVSCYSLMTRYGIDVGTTPDYCTLQDETKRLFELIDPWEHELQDLLKSSMLLKKSNMLLNSENLKLKSRNERLSARLHDLEAGIARIKNTYLWRVSKPLLAIYLRRKRFSG